MVCSGTTSVTAVRIMIDLEERTIVMHIVLVTNHRRVAVIELSASTQVHSATITLYYKSIVLAYE